MRFGDPETEAMLPRLKSDLLSLLYAASKGMLDGITIELHDRAALCVVMAAQGYPGEYKKGTVIRGLDAAAAIADSFVFQAAPCVTYSAKSPPMAGAFYVLQDLARSIAEAQSRRLSNGR